jgi:hypothetical protein
MELLPLDQQGLLARTLRGHDQRQVRLVGTTQPILNLQKIFAEGRIVQVPQVGRQRRVQTCQQATRRNRLLGQLGLSSTL